MYEFCECHFFRYSNFAGLAIEFMKIPGKIASAGGPWQRLSLLWGSFLQSSVLSTYIMLNSVRLCCHICCDQLSLREPLSDCTRNAQKASSMSRVWRMKSTAKYERFLYELWNTLHKEHIFAIGTWFSLCPSLQNASILQGRVWKSHILLQPTYS